MPAQSGSLSIDKTTARRFLLLHQGLVFPRKNCGKTGIKKILGKVGCIQFDPVNVVGRNPDLVLFARVKDYHAGLLDELLYKDFKLFDACDKQASICLVEDWPFFSLHRQRMTDTYWNKDTPESRLAPILLEKIREVGHESALKEFTGEHIQGRWGFPVRVERAALEILMAVRKIHIIKRIGSRRVFDLTENVLPTQLLEAANPNKSLDEYHDWHVQRRMGGLGLVQATASDFWLGIHSMKTPQRQHSIDRLLEKGLILPVTIQELPHRPFFIRAQDRAKLKAAEKMDLESDQATFLPPLDNLLWDRKLVKLVFDFDYVWEIYKKPEQRRYGCYTMPVLFGDRFIARFEPLYDRKSRTLIVRKWWWEDGLRIDQKALEAIDRTMEDFRVFLQAERVAFQPDSGFNQVRPDS